MKRKNAIHTIVLLLLLFCCGTGSLWAQNDNRVPELEQRLDALTRAGVALEETVTISLSGSIQELVSFLAESTSVNISIDPQVQSTVSTTFTDAEIKDIILYLCDTYQLDFKVTGSIIHLIPFRPDPPPVEPRLVEVEYDETSQLLTINMRNDTLANLAQKISELTGKNIALQPEVRRMIVNGYINGLSFEAALSQLAASNNLQLEQTDDFTLIRQATAVDGQPAGPLPPGANGNRTASRPDLNVENLLVQKITDDKVSIQALNVPVLDVIREVAIQLNADYYLLPDRGGAGGQAGFNRGARQGQPGNNRGQQGGGGAALAPSSNTVSIQIKEATFGEVLDRVCLNSDFSYKEDNGLFVIGTHKAEGLRALKMIKLEYRSAKGILGHIPPELLNGVDIDTLYELNSIILSGSERGVEEIGSFIEEIDELVPVVMIELIIVDVQTNKLDEFGIEVGVTPGGREAGGSIISSSDDRGGTDFTFSPGAINNLLSSLAGRGIINLGQVTDDFYLSLKALQEKGIIEVKSTPKLATLNGHPATLSIGQKRYFQEQQVNFPGTDRPIPVQANVFREVEANLDINVSPIVSGDEQVTMDIDFEQSEFQGETSINAPPPQVSRRFESAIRVKNGEMVVLGGLERDSRSDLKRGVPFFSRLPLIGWLFGRKRKSQQKDKLLIFVKPTIVY
ncbi:MAG: hypothetical protein AAGG75_23615 [Bacteroidota bacterium]